MTNALVNIIGTIMLLIVAIIVLYSNEPTVSESYDIVAADTTDIVVYSPNTKVIILDKPIREIHNKELVIALEVLETEGDYIVLDSLELQMRLDILK